MSLYHVTVLGVTVNHVNLGCQVNCHIITVILNITLRHITVKSTHHCHTQAYHCQGKHIILVKSTIIKVTQSSIYCVIMETTVINIIVFMIRVIILLQETVKLQASFLMH